MSQKLSWGLFIAGFASFLVAISHDFAAYTSWQDLTTPKSVGEILFQIGTATIGVVGALGVNLQKKE